MAIERAKKTKHRKPTEDPFYPAAVKGTKEATQRLQKMGVIDSAGRRIKRDLPPDMREGAERDFGG